MKEKGLVIKNVELGRFTEVISYVFWAKKSHRNPVKFATELAGTPYQGWAGGARFFVFPTPFGWGWGYETLSRRQLLWVPVAGILLRKKKFLSLKELPWTPRETDNGNVYFINMNSSVNFRRYLESKFGRKLKKTRVPNWIFSALRLQWEINRIDEDDEDDQCFIDVEANVEREIGGLQVVIENDPEEFLREL